MKRVLIGLFALCFSTLAFAADLGGTIKVYDGDQLVVESTNKFFGLDADEEAAFKKSAMAQLDYASKHQDKGGKYKMVWAWGDGTPAVETPGMSLKAVNQTLRRGTWWLASILDHSDANAGKGGKHWGNKGQAKKDDGKGKAK